MSVKFALLQIFRAPLQISSSVFIAPAVFGVEAFMLQKLQRVSKVVLVVTDAAICVLKYFGKNPYTVIANGILELIREDK